MQGLPDIVEDLIRRWAAATPEVERVWLFGSRARGTHRIDSDIDLAIAIQGWDSDDEDEVGVAYAEWTFLGGGWSHQLSAVTPLPIHLSPVFLDDERVLPAVRREGRLLYERDR